MNTKLLLKLPQTPPLEVELNTVSYGHNGYLNFYHEGQLVAGVGGRPDVLADELHRIALLLIPRSIADVDAGLIRGRPAGDFVQEWKRRPDPLNMTPAQVIAYFEQSPELASIAPDVRAALEPLITETGENPDVKKCMPHLDNILDENGGVKWGGLTVIADILNIANSGPTNTKRIKRVASALQGRKKNSSSTPAPAAISLAA